MADGFDVAEIDGAERPAHAFDGAPKQTALDGDGLGEKLRCTEQNGLGMELEYFGFQAAELGIPPGFFSARPLGGGGEDFRERRIEGAELRHDIMAQAVTQELRLGVRAIFAPGEVAVAEPGPDVFAAEAEQGPDDAFAGDGPDAAETGGSGATQKAGEDRFGLVVNGVAGGDSVALSGLDEFEEEGVTRATGFLFEIALGNRAGGDMDGKSRACANSETKASSASESVPRSLWLTCRTAAASPHSWSAWRRKTESAPPDTATPMRRPRESMPWRSMVAAMVLDRFSAFILRCLDGCGGRTILLHNGDVGTLKKTIRQSVSLPSTIATQVRSMAKVRRLSANRMLIELIENGLEAEKRKQQEFFDLAERFRGATEPEDVKRLGDQLGRMVFGG